MRIADREMAWRELPRAGYALAALLSRLCGMRHPLRLLLCYLRRQSPGGVELRSGHTIRFTTHPHDIVTFFVVFLKRDYGRVAPGSVVVDIGANFGAFALSAAMAGARKVYAIEPCREAFNTLCENIRRNGFENVVFPLRRAAGSADGMCVRFPCAASPYNQSAAPGVDAEPGDYDEVATVSLDTLLREQRIGRVDLLKMDCEGAEFDILPGLQMADRIDRIRLECHGDPAPLLACLTKKGYALQNRYRNDLWFVRI